MLAFGLALAVLILAAARPQRTVAVPVDSAVDHARNDTSELDGGDRRLAPRLAAAEKAANRFLRRSRDRSGSA